MPFKVGDLVGIKSGVGYTKNPISRIKGGPYKITQDLGRRRWRINRAYDWDESERKFKEVKRNARPETNRLIHNVENEESMVPWTEDMKIGDLAPGAEVPEVSPEGKFRVGDKVVVGYGPSASVRIVMGGPYKYVIPHRSGKRETVFRYELDDPDFVVDVNNFYIEDEMEEYPKPAAAEGGAPAAGAGGRGGARKSRRLNRRKRRQSRK